MFICLIPPSTCCWTLLMLLSSSQVYHRLIAEGTQFKLDKPGCTCLAGSEPCCSLQTNSSWQEASSYREVMVGPPEASKAIFREVHRVGVIDVLHSIPVEAEVLVQDALNLMHQRAYHLQMLSC